MTSMVSRADLEDQLYLITPRKTDIDRLLKLIDSYAVTLAHKLQPTIEWRPGQWLHLKPGDTDINAGMRKCLECTKVKSLDEFEKQTHGPNGRKIRCNTCRPPRNTRKDDQYYCKRCRKYKHISEYPEERQQNRTLSYNCNECQGN